MTQFGHSPLSQPTTVTVSYATCKQKQVLYSAIRQPILLVVHMYVKHETWNGMDP